MIPISKMSLIQIELTNACINQCANCTRFVGHHKKPFFMDLATFRKAIESLEGYRGNIGLMGGEPTLHPQFREICELFIEMVPDKKRRQLWTSGYEWKEYEDIILKTFYKKHISYNEHSTPGGKHTPLLVAIKDMAITRKEAKEFIDKCWVQPRWSASITPSGCYFCEVAGAMDIMLGGKHGYPIEKGWWKKTPTQYQDQVNAICFNCGAMIPVGECVDRATYDIISISNLKALLKTGSPKVKNKNYALYPKKWTKAEILKAQNEKWKPFQWRDWYAHCPEDYARHNKIIQGKRK